MEYLDAIVAWVCHTDESLVIHRYTPAMNAVQKVKIVKLIFSHIVRVGIESFLLKVLSEENLFTRFNFYVICEAKYWGKVKY